MIRFEIGKTYVVGLMADHTIRLPFTVVGRTEKMVVLRDKHHNIKRRRVLEGGDVEEFVYPLGRYSMAPIMRASRDIEK